MYGKGNPQDIYRNLREDRNDLRTENSKLLQIKYEMEAEIFDEAIPDEFVKDRSDVSVEDQDEEEDKDRNGDDYLIKNASFSKNFNTFKLSIPNCEYEKMKHTLRNYKGREREVLERDVWANTINDFFFQHYELPRAYVMKKLMYQEILTIILLQFMDDAVKRQLRGRKRQIIGE